MSSDEKILNDVAETEDEGYFEAYIRFNADMEKDYCFQFKASTTFRDLYVIFEKLPIALRPSLFYNSKPIGFQVSTSPGYLTEDGALLFDYEADNKKYLKNVDLDDKISEKIWPGQLILPVWEFNYFGFYAFLSALLVWLYTDLPDAISPTPGICLTNQMSRFLSWLARYFGQGKLAVALIDDINDPVGLVAQCIFFSLHIFKTLAIFLVFYTGTFNPIRLFRISSRSVSLQITRDELLAIGWTGSRRATPDEYQEFYREYKIKEHGGLIQAHKAGLFDKLSNLGVILKDGEGFNTPRDRKATLKDMLDENNKEFLLNYGYIAKLGQCFALALEEGADVQESIKQFRRYGLIHSTETIAKIVAKRKAVELDEKAAIISGEKDKND